MLSLSSCNVVVTSGAVEYLRVSISPWTGHLLVVFEHAGEGSPRTIGARELQVRIKRDAAGIGSQEEISSLSLSLSLRVGSFSDRASERARVQPMICEISEILLNTSVPWRNATENDRYIVHGPRTSSLPSGRIMIMLRHS